MHKKIKWLVIGALLFAVIIGYFMLATNSFESFQEAINAQESLTNIIKKPVLIGEVEKVQEEAQEIVDSDKNKIYINPGHGGWAATGSRKESDIELGTSRGKGDLHLSNGKVISEEEYVYNIASMLKSKLEQNGYKAILSRDKDSSFSGLGSGNSQRGKEASEYIGVVSIHTNAGNDPGCVNMTVPGYGYNHTMGDTFINGMKELGINPLGNGYLEWNEVFHSYYIENGGNPNTILNVHLGAGDYSPDADILYSKQEQIVDVLYKAVTAQVIKPKNTNTKKEEKAPKPNVNDGDCIVELEDGTKYYWYRQYSSGSGRYCEAGGYNFAQGFAHCNEGGSGNSMGSMCPLYAASIAYSNCVGKQYDPLSFAELCGGSYKLVNGKVDIDLSNTFFNSIGSNSVNANKLAAILNNNGCDAKVVSPLTANAIKSYIDKGYFIITSAEHQHMGESGSGRHYIVLRKYSGNTLYKLDSNVGTKYGGSLDVSAGKLKGPPNNQGFNLATFKTANGWGVACKGK